MHLPTGYRRAFTPGLCPEAIALVQERDQRRSQDPNDPGLEDLNRRISSVNAAAAHARWIAAMEEADQKANLSCFWNLLARLSGKRSNRTPPNQPITFDGNTYVKHKHIADKFCQQYSNIKYFKPNKESRKIIRELRINNPLDRSYSPFSAVMTAEAIKASRKSTAAGPNGLTPLHLRHLGPMGIRFLTRLLNLSVREACVPVIWRSARFCIRWTLCKLLAVVHPQTEIP